MRPKRDQDLNHAVGTRIRIARLRAGLTQERLAERLGVEPTTVYRFESGRRGVTLPMLLRIAAVLNVRAAELLDMETPAHLLPAYADGEAVTELLAVFQRLDPGQRALAVQLVRVVGSA
jgi:transcriptional regulator with XRE-family HTH domain